MRKSIFFRYFIITFSLITTAILVSSSFIIYRSTETYKSHRLTYMTDSTDGVIPVLSDYIENEDDNGIEALTTRGDMGFFLFDEGGRILLSYNNCSVELSGEDSISQSVMMLSTESGYFAESTMGGFFGEKVIYIIRTLTIGDSSYYMVTCVSNTEKNLYLLNMIVSTLIMLVVLLLVIGVLLRYIIKKTFEPLDEITSATKRFGNSDFSTKIAVKDDSELSFLASTINDMADALESTEENRKSFISNVSHELKTPMTTIGGFVDGILDGTIPEKEHRHYLKIVSEEVERLSRLVRSMLNISKYEAGEMELQTMTFNIVEATFNTVLLFEKRIEEKHLDIIGLDAEKHMIEADSDLIKQVIYNLTENAVKFVNDGGYISFNFKIDNDNVFHFYIRNSGEGLQKHEINKVFDKFYKTDESRGKDTTGVGLGLSIVRSIVTLHGGEILVRSKVGEYTEFEFTLKQER